MDKVKSGLAFHVHHDILFEFCHDYDERIRFIKQDKPIEERELRLRLFQLIPEDKLPRGTKAYDKAREAYYKAEEACDKAREDCNKAGKAHYKAREAYDKAGEAHYKAGASALEKLHQELCPNCPFDNKTIFTRRDKAGKWY